MQDIIVSWLANLPSLAVPYALASLGLIISERSGVLSLGAEGLMLVGALAGVAAYLSFGGYPLLALVVAMIAAAIVSILFAVLVVLLRVNQVIAGLSLVFFCQGFTNLVGTVANWSNRTISGLHALPIYPLSELPVVGRMLFIARPDRLFDHPDFHRRLLFPQSDQCGLALAVHRREPGSSGCRRP